MKQLQAESIRQIAGRNKVTLAYVSVPYGLNPLDGGLACYRR